MMFLYFLAAVGILFLLFLIIWWLVFNYGGETAKMGLRLFRSVYLINPSKWFYKSEYWDDTRSLYYDKSYCHSTQVRLTFLAFVWFLYRYHSRKYILKKEERRHELAGVLEGCQKDIDRIKRRSEEEMMQAINEQKRILENWK